MKEIDYTESHTLIIAAQRVLYLRFFFSDDEYRHKHYLRA